MSIRTTVIILAVSAGIAAYIFYAAVPVPDTMKHRDEVFKIYLKRKLIRGLSIAGEYFGLGHRLTLTRSLTSMSLLTLYEPADFTNVKTEKAVFDGVPVKIYEPKIRVDKSPALIWIHGGGWALGSAESDDILVVELVRRLGIIIISIDYRLAPEFPFPIPFDDCYKATVYFLNNAASFRADPFRVVLGGVSAGGNLAAAVSLKIRDLDLAVKPSIQVLIVPCLQAFDFNTPSYQQNMNNAFLTQHLMVNYWLWYAHGFDGHLRCYEYAENQHTSAFVKSSDVAKFVDHNLVNRKSIRASYTPNSVNFGNDTLWREIEPIFLNPYFAPLMARNLSALPEAYIATAEWDVLRDDGAMYAKRLAGEGDVDVEHNHYEQGFHYLYSRPQVFEQTERFTRDLVEYLARRM